MSTVLEKAWLELDGVVDDLMALKARRDATVLELEKLKHYAAGMAAVISLFMSAYYPTPEAVSLEAAKRRARRMSNIAYESPGLGARRFEKEVKDVADTREG